MKRHLITAIFAFVSVIVMAQQKPESFKKEYIKTANGLTIKFTGFEHQFFLTVNSEKTEIKSKDYLKADGKVLQNMIIPFPQKINYESLSVESQKENLLAYYKYEMNYLKKQLGQDSLNEEYEFLTLNNKLFLYWHYEMPDSGKNVYHQCYLVTACFDNILVLNSPVDFSQKISSIKDFLMNTGATLLEDNL